MDETNHTEIVDATTTASPELLHFDEADPEVARKMIKLLATAENEAATEDEIKNALALVQRLAIKNRIDLATVTRSDSGMAPPEEAMSKEDLVVGIGRRRPPADRFITYILLSFFNVEIIYKRKIVERTEEEWCKAPNDIWAEGYGENRKYYGRCSVVEFLGRTSDVRFAIYCYGFLRISFARGWRAYRREHKALHGYDAPMSERASYYDGFFRGLSSKLAKEKIRAEQELLGNAEASAQYSLAVVTDKEKRQNFVKGEHPVLSTMKQREVNITSRRAQTTGYDAGKKLDIALAVE